MVEHPENGVANTQGILVRPIDFINQLKTLYTNTDIDWELLLERGYREFLSPDSAVLDVGGHAGRHAEIFIDEIGCQHVAIFEPLPQQFAALKKRYEGRSNVHLYQLALSSKSGESSFVFNMNAPEESGLRERVYNDPSGKGRYPGLWRLCGH